MNYIVCGQMMPFILKDENFDIEVPIMCGTAFCAVTGVRLWTESVLPVAKAGRDFSDIYGEWLARHGVPDTSIIIDKDISCSQAPGKIEKNWIDAEIIDAAAQYDDSKAVYVAVGQDIDFWRDLYDIKTRKGMKVMWEYVENSSPGQKISLNSDIMTFTDMWSINISEASRLFDIPEKNEEDIISEIMKFPLELALLRVGARGSYAITPSGAAMCESIDIDKARNTAGCGSVATGAAMYAHCEGYAPAMVAVMANVAAGYHAAQTGPIDHITPQVMKDAREKADSYYQKITGRV